MRRARISSGATTKQNVKIPNRSLLLATVIAVTFCTPGCVATRRLIEYRGVAERMHVLQQQKGSQRSEILHYFGQPRASRVEDDKIVDSYLAPNDTWIHRSFLVTEDPPFGCLLMFPICIVEEATVDPVWSAVLAHENREETQCEYVVTYGKDERVSSVELRYPRELGPSVCSGATAPR